jgi:hypothetical protein
MKTLRATCSSSSRPAEPVARVVQTKTEQAWFDEQLKLNHDLGATKSIGDFLRQIIEIDSKPVALLAWGQPVTPSRIATSGLVGALPSVSSGSSSACRTAVC